MDNSYSVLLIKLKGFVRKFYFNKTLSGLLYSLVTTVVLLSIFAIAEFIGHYNIITRTVLFYTLCSLLTFVFIYWVITPFLRYLSIGKRLTHRQAAIIIGKHFPEIEDKLLNVLELKQQKGAEGVNQILIEAAINQKAEKMTLYSFTSAIPLKESLKYAKYAIIPIAIWLVWIIISPEVAQKPIHRIINHKVYYEKIPPFVFVLLNDTLNGVKSEDFKLLVTTSGEEVPETIFIKIEDYPPVAMKKNSRNEFEYYFYKLQNNVRFVLLSGEEISQLYTITVFPRPVVLQHEALIQYPPYTGIPNNSIQNSAYYHIPNGSTIIFDFFLRDAEGVSILSSDTTVYYLDDETNKCVVEKQFFETESFQVVPQNSFTKAKDTLLFTVEIIQDEYPIIVSTSQHDALFGENIYFKVSMEDDYGFSKLHFVVTKLSGISIIDTLPIQRGVLQTELYFTTTLDKYGILPGERVSYHFELWDNDGINGPKMSKSRKEYFETLTTEERQEKIDESTAVINNTMSQAKEEAFELNKKVEELQKKLLQQEALDWEDWEEVKQLLQKQEELNTQLNQLNEELYKKSMMETSFEKPNEELLQKQAELERLFEEVMTEEMKEMLQDIQEMIDKAEAEKVQEALQEMQESLEEYEENLDRNLALFKQLEFEKKLDQTINEIRKLEEDQRTLKKEVENAKRDDFHQKKEEQKALNERFMDVKEQLEKLDEMNQNLASPTSYKKPEEEIKGADDAMKSSEQELSKKKKKTASKEQQKAAESLESLGDKMQQMQQMMMQAQAQESMEEIRMLIENLLYISFHQEAVLEKTKNVRRNSPQFVDYQLEQNRINQLMNMVSDSLHSLAKRQIQISRPILKELKRGELSMEEALNNFKERYGASPSTKQQFAMMSINNLALLLQEVLMSMQQQQQQQQSSKKSKSGMCDKPSSSGGGKASSMPSMKQMQEQLSKQLEEMQSQKKGQQKGGEGEGKSGGKKGKSGSEQLAKMAAQQMAVRQMMQEYQDQQGGGEASTGLKKMMQMMEETETDIINAAITRETLTRQKEILTRMLKAEEAEKEREKDKKRMSKEVKSQKYSNPNGILKYKEKVNEGEDALITIPPEFKRYYRLKSSRYIKEIEE